MRTDSPPAACPGRRHDRLRRVPRRRLGPGRPALELPARRAPRHAVLLPLLDPELRRAVHEPVRHRALHRADQVARRRTRTTSKIPFVTHLGDIVDRATETAEWDVADEAMKVIDDAKLPYSIPTGNHDATGNPATEPFPRYFPNDARRRAVDVRRSRRDRPAASGTRSRPKAARSSCSRCRGPPTTPTIEWAKGVIAANPTLPVILTTHDLLAHRERRRHRRRGHAAAASVGPADQGHTTRSS